MKSLRLYLASCLCVLLILYTFGGLRFKIDLSIVLSACSNISQKPTLKLDTQMPETAKEPQPGRDYLLQRFLGSDNMQAMRRALTTFGASKDRHEADSQLLQGEQHEPSLTARLRASLFGTDLGANLGYFCLLSCLLLP